MPEIEPTAELHEGFSQPDATATPWAEVVDVLSRSEMFWLSTVRRDGRPHVTPLPAVWLDGALRFCAGAGEQKAKNLEADPRCVLTTGTNQLRSRRRGRGSCRSRDRRGAAPTAGGDVVVEARLAFRGRLRGVPRSRWSLGARLGRHTDEGPLVRQGEPFGQTRYRFTG